RDVIHAPRLPGGLPRSPDDSAWARVERYWFPLVGQVIRKPRRFAPAVAGVWVQAVHTADSLALRLEWDARSQRPDTAWLQFAPRRRPVAPRPHARPCDCGYGKRTSVRSWPRHSGRVLRLGRLQWGARHADGGQRLVFPRPRSADAAASVSLSGGRHGRDSRTRHAGGGA